MDFNKNGCLIWIGYFLIWVLIGAITYSFFDPKGILLFIGWLFAWQILTIIIDLIIISVFLLIDSILERRELEKEV